MKYSQLIGVLAALALIGCCFLPWTLIESRQLMVTGLYSGRHRFWETRPHEYFLSGITIICFAVPKIWAKVPIFYCRH